MGGDEAGVDSRTRSGIKATRHVTGQSRVDDTTGELGVKQLRLLSKLGRRRRFHSRVELIHRVWHSSLVAGTCHHTVDCSDRAVAQSDDDERKRIFCTVPVLWFRKQQF
jgi:hypothetical protein